MKSFRMLAGAAAALALTAGLAGCASGPAPEELDQEAVRIIRSAFRDEGIAKVDRLDQDAANEACSRALGKEPAPEVVKAIEAAHPGVKVVTAYTSHIIIDRVAKNEGIKYPTPEEALTQLKDEGYTRVALASLDVIPGMEYNYDLGVYHNYKNQFKKMTLGTSLMYWQGQENQPDDVTETIKALATQFPKQGKHDAILIMAHGTPQVSNAYYSVIQAKIDELGYKNVFVYTVEGWPSLETVLPKLKANGIKKVTLMPMMMVAGDHANNDMADETDPDSWAAKFVAAGFEVTCLLQGLGQNVAVDDIYVSHVDDAIAKL